MNAESTDASTRSRRRNVRLIRQTQHSECGVACLAMIANAYGCSLSSAALHGRLDASSRGSTLRSLVRAAGLIGLTARAVRLGLADLKHLHLPAILHWDANHFVVVERVRRKQVHIHDPRGRSAWLNLSDVSPHFTGLAIEVRPAATFTPVVEKRRLKLSQLWGHVTGLGPALFQILLLSIFLQAFVLISPYYIQVAIDRAVPSMDHGLLGMLALGFGLFALFNSAAALLRALVLLSAGSELSFGMATKVARHLFRLPLSWFERREIGDVISRFQSIDPIRQFLTEAAVASVLDGSLALFTLIVMFFYSPVLALIALSSFLLYGALRGLSYAAQRTAQEEALIATAREQSTLIESLRGISTLRACNREIQHHSHWQNRLGEAVNANIRAGTISTVQNVGNGLIFGVEQVLTIWLAVASVVDGYLTVGMVFAYFAYRSQFQQKAAALIDFAITIRLLSLHLDRLSDIALSPPEAGFERLAGPPQPPVGRLELSNIGFRYGTSEPWIFRGLNLTIERGEHIAITGPSGGGKTTLVKVLLGLLDPEEGEILIDGVPLRSFGGAALRDQVGVVLQDDHIFTGSLRDNIAMFEESVDLDLVQVAARQAGLAADIDRMPMKYDTLVSQAGSSLSGGQKQRLMLARALYRQPTILVLDEGTAHLDRQLEKSVGESIASMGITRIVVAHRIETISIAERIMHLENSMLTDVTDRVKGAPIGLVIPDGGRDLQTGAAGR